MVTGRCGNAIFNTLSRVDAIWLNYIPVGLDAEQVSRKVRVKAYGTASHLSVRVGNALETSQNTMQLVEDYVNTLDHAKHRRNRPGRR